MPESNINVIRKALVRRKAGSVPTRVPLVYLDRSGVLQYGTAWARQDLPATRAADQFAAGAVVVIASRAQRGSDDALDAYGPGEYVRFTTDESIIRLHDRKCLCAGGEGHSSEGDHLKIIFANPSRNAWCNEKGNEYRASKTARPSETLARTAEKTADPTTRETARRKAGTLDKRALIVARGLELPRGKARADWFARHGMTPEAVKAVVDEYRARRAS